MHEPMDGEPNPDGGMDYAGFNPPEAVAGGGYQQINNPEGMQVQNAPSPESGAPFLPADDVDQFLSAWGPIEYQDPSLLPDQSQSNTFNLNDFSGPSSSAGPSAASSSSVHPSTEPPQGPIFEYEAPADMVSIAMEVAGLAAGDAQGEIVAQMPLAVTPEGCDAIIAPQRLRARFAMQCELTKEEKQGGWTEESSEVTEDGFKIVMQSDVTGKSLVLSKEIPETHRPLESWKQNTMEWVGRISKGLGRFGMVMGLMNGINSIRQGHVGQGVAVLAMTGFQATTDLVSSIPKLQEAVSKASSKLILKTAEGIGSLLNLGENLIETLGKSMIRIVEEAIPFVGFVFGCWMVYEDFMTIQRYNGTDIGKKIILVINLILDVVITVLSLGSDEFPPLEIVVVILTIVRMSLELIYDSVKIAEKICSKKRILPRFACVPGVTMENFITLGYAGSKMLIDIEAREWKERIQALQNFHTYYKIDGDCIGSGRALINFNAGKSSSYGGDIIFHLLQDQRYKLSMGDIPNYGHTGKRVTKVLGPCRALRDIGLGTGESYDFEYKFKLYRTLLGPVLHGQLVVSKLTKVEESLKGIYWGNEQDNRFYAAGRPDHREDDKFIDCHSFHGFGRLDSSIVNYHYELHGEGGDDAFILHGGKYSVTGGNGRDSYIINGPAISLVVDNFADDKLTDLLVISAELRILRCFLDDGDMLITDSCNAKYALRDYDPSGGWQHNNPGYRVALRSYRQAHSGKKRGHLRILTKDFFLIDSDCSIWGIDASSSKKAINVDFSLGLKYERGMMFSKWGRRYKPRELIGTNFDDRLIGNELDNSIAGGKGINYLSGKGGSDTYYIHKDSTNTILDADNADFPAMNHLILAARFSKIKAYQAEDDLVLKSYQDGLKVTIKMFFYNLNSPFTIISEDSFIFGVQTIEEDIVTIPYILDYSNEPKSVRANLRMKRVDGLPRKADLSKITSVIGSNFSDNFVGNDATNMFVCRGNGVYMEGGGGSDIYQITETCGATIELLSQDSEVDSISFFCKHGQLLVCPEIYWQHHETKSSDLLLSCHHDLQSGVCAKSRRIRIKNFFKNPKARNFQALTKDGASLSYPDFEGSSNSHPKQLVITGLEILDKSHPLGIEVDLQNHKNKHGVHDLEKVSTIRVNVSDSNITIYGSQNENAFFPGQKSRKHSTFLEGRNGSDKYFINPGDGRVTINNFATDRLPDMLILPFRFESIRVAIDPLKCVMLFDEINPDRTQITIKHYWKSSLYQHLYIKTVEGYQMNLTKTFPYKQAFIIDQSTSNHSQYIQVGGTGKRGFSFVKSIAGSNTQSNVIFGGRHTVNIYGGRKNDSLFGGPQGETLEGFGGDDMILGRSGDDVLIGGPGNDSLFGGRGNDVLYGGSGQDLLYGGSGFDTVVFQGTFLSGNVTGVTINLRDGVGNGGDAQDDFFKSIEGIMGTVFDDRLIDDDDNTEIRAGPGADVIEVGGGIDYIVGDSGRDTFSMETAYGHKKVDNFDNSSKIEVDVLSFASDTQPEDIVKTHWCMFALDSSLFLRLNKNLSILLHNWFLSDHYRHLRLQAFHNHSKCMVPTPIVKSRVYWHLSTKIELKIEAVKIREDDAFILTRCINCGSVNPPVELIIGPEHDANVTKYVIDSHPSMYDVRNLDPGRSYSITPIIELCQFEAVRGRTLTVQTKPSSPINLELQPLEGGILYLKWGIDKDRNLNWKRYIYCVSVKGSIPKPRKDEKVQQHMTTWYNQHSFCTKMLHGFIFLDKNNTHYNHLNVTIDIVIHYSTVNSSVATLEKTITSFMNCSDAKQRGVPSPKWMCLSDKEEAEVKIRNQPKKPRCLKGAASYRDEVVCKSPLLIEPNLHPFDSLKRRAISRASVFHHMQRVEIRCSSSYVFYGRAKYTGKRIKTTCVSGQWRPPIPYCGSTCNHLRPPKNGRIVQNGTTARYYCKWNYYLLGPWLRRCSGTYWERNGYPSLCVS